MFQTLKSMPCFHEFRHLFLLDKQFTYGFYASEVTVPGIYWRPGRLDNPDDAAGLGDPCTPILINDCCYDMTVFRTAVFVKLSQLAINPPRYTAGFSDCRNLHQWVMDYALEKSKRKDLGFFSSISCLASGYALSIANGFPNPVGNGIIDNRHQQNIEEKWGIDNEEEIFNEVWGN